MENPRSEEEDTIKDARNLFRLKKQQNGTATKDIRNLFRLKKEIKGIKDIIPRNIKNVFEYQKKEVNYYKPVRLNTFWSSNIKVKHINVEYKSNDDRNKTLSVEEYLDKIRPYLKDIINDLKKSDTWTIQLRTTINFISF